MLISVLIALHPVLPGMSAVGSFLCFGMSLVTLSFSLTTPETWVPALGDAHCGFAFLSGTGRLILKDAIMLGAGLETMAQAVRKYLLDEAERQQLPTLPGEYHASMTNL